ncbi:hypothetical protein SAMN02990966_03959 [Rhodospirillales bacterium URHD0017]|nr:hypothetical protein SAMN02990966_03959 [Rhodospirillales bacterium URHD0017]
MSPSGRHVGQLVKNHQLKSAPGATAKSDASRAALARWPSEPYLSAMTDDLQAAAHRIVEAMARQFPHEASIVGALVVIEVLAVGLDGRDNQPADVTTFVQAVNTKLAEVALHHRADHAWRLVPCDPPTRQ